MSVWFDKIDVRDTFYVANTEEAMVLTAERMASRRDDFGDEEYDALVEELTDAASAEDESWFNLVWNEVYNWADYNRVWIQTV